MDVNLFKKYRDEARREKNTENVTFFSTVIGEIERVSSKIPTSEECVKAIKKFVKNAEEMLAECPDNARVRWEKEFLEALLPKEVSEEQLTEVVSKNMSNIGAAMKAVKEAFGEAANMQKAREIFNTLKG